MKAGLMGLYDLLLLFGQLFVLPLWLVKKKYREKLIESFQYKRENYLKGICCPCCVTKQEYNYQNGLLKEDMSDNNLTWANLLINGNLNLKN